MSYLHAQVRELVEKVENIDKISPVELVEMRDQLEVVRLISLGHLLSLPEESTEAFCVLQLCAAIVFLMDGLKGGNPRKYLREAILLFKTTARKFLECGKG